MKDALSLLPGDWTVWLTEHGQPSYRAGQIFSWLYKGIDFDDMSDLPKSLRQKLKDSYGESFPHLHTRQVSRDGTEKFLWTFRGGQTAESVAMRYAHGLSACLSSQIGCRMGCTFCASALCGFERNMSGGEIAGQLLAMQSAIGERFSHAVLMGMGEPLDNIENVLHFFSLIHHHNGLDLSLRRVSLSTCGTERGLLQLTEAALPVTLSVSLHAPDNDTRSLLVPSNKAIGVERLIELCKLHYAKTGRRVTYEYVMISSVTDRSEQAAQLVRLLHTGSHINLIPLNPVAGSLYRTGSPEQIKRFAAVLESGGLNVTVRRRLGADIDAACGQLRNAAQSKTEA
jgi:23S rRNA (adenine2503-C2)-methyltransferase